MRYRYDLAAMGDFVDALDKQITEITDRCAEVRSATGEVLATYKGTAAEAFNTTQSQWQSDMEERIKQLQALRTHVATCKRNYEEADRVILKMFGS
ncbi:WXG100 family type VII secretion target [Tsukamurella strandjordii]|uniref:ESAT-6-like protein n=1 Tax=Tsukamurella strandjordii TaxID=147577 RepID=A0AA90NFE0_9ACTN|nr:WXG100 family type VII secretion target [Tsukamurella strandjordii]MDP0398128.1 WXG100 family type VII secretion target [Tsukamurella strandjordii]